MNQVHGQTCGCSICAQLRACDAQVQAQQLGQQGMADGLDFLRVSNPGQQQVQLGVPSVRCCNCDGKLQHCQDGIVRCNRCHAPHTVFADAHPPRLPRDRDGMLLADRLQVLADENVTLLAENARLRRRVEELERKR